MTESKTVTPPYTPYVHQKPVLDYLRSGGLRAVLVWHRRAGKDLTTWNWTWVAAQRRVGTYYYFFPTYAQGRKVIWQGMDEEGRSFRSYIPEELIAGRPHDTEMRINFVNGSVIQIIGADNIDTIVGTNPVGCVFSEYAIMDPRAFRMVSPILAKNGGWAVFCYTPRGFNHGYDLYNRAQNNPNWFVQCLSIEDTGLVSLAAVEDQSVMGMPEELIQQEYYCSFNMTLVGAYFGQQMMKSEEAGRIRELTYEPKLPVHTAWDIGVNDSTFIWFIQYDGRTVWAIDTYENHNVGMDHYAGILHSKGYNYGIHLCPHDVVQRGKATATPLRDDMEQMGIRPIEVVKRLDKVSQVQAAHLLIPRTIFCKVRADQGIQGLRAYEREWNDRDKVHRNAPKHNWASNIADAYMVLACGIDMLEESSSSPMHSTGMFDPRRYETYAANYGDFDPRSVERLSNVNHIKEQLEKSTGIWQSEPC